MNNRVTADNSDKILGSVFLSKRIAYKVNLNLKRIKFTLIKNKLVNFYCLRKIYIKFYKLSCTYKGYFACILAGLLGFENKYYKDVLWLGTKKQILRICLVARKQYGYYEAFYKG